MSRRVPALLGARLVLPAFMALALLTLTGVGARASLYLVLSASTASPGSVVFGYTPGRGAVAAAKGEMLPLFLVPTSQAEEIGSMEDPRLATAGWLSVDQSGDGHASIIVPPLTPGSYTLMVVCEPCASTSSGRSVLPVAEIAVLPFGDQVQTSPLAELLGALVRALCRVGV